MVKRIFSRRSGIERGPNRLSAAVSRARADGRELLDLTLSNPTRADLPYPERELLDALSDSEALRYEPDPLGMLSAREAVARHVSKTQGVRVSPEHVMLTASTSEAYALLFKLLCDPGDEVMVPRPGYPLFELLARQESVRGAPYDSRYDGSWYLDLETLPASRTERTRAVLAVSPNNPTGAFIKRDELRAIADLRLPIISDEVFAAYSMDDAPDPRRAGSALELNDTLVFALNGLSKLAGLPQLKLSWICAGGPDDLLDEAWQRLSLMADTYLSVATPVQLALPRILRSHGVVARAIRERVRRNLKRTRRDASAVSPLRVEGGWYATLRLPATLSDEQWALTLLEEEGLYIYPGYYFDHVGPSLLVVSLLTPEPIFDEGMQRLFARVGG
jgi:aspartate/methionine/tyrosine aminotransferase